MQTTRPPGSVPNEDFSGLPGAELVTPGLDDLRNEKTTECALLVLIVRPRLIRLGIDIPERPDINRPYEHRLYELLEDTHGDGAFSRYNSLLRRIDSFLQAL